MHPGNSGNNCLKLGSYAHCHLIPTFVSAGMVHNLAKVIFNWICYLKFGVFGLITFVFDCFVCLTCCLTVCIHFHFLFGYIHHIGVRS